MKIAFMGLGGVGGYYGGKVARAFEGGSEHQVAFVARGEHLAAIREKGLEVRAREGRFFAKPFIAADDPAKIGRADLVVFAVKGYDLRSAALAAAPMAGPDTAVLPLLNGANNNEILKEALPPCRVLNGCVYISARIEAPGVVVQSGGNCRLFFGAPGEGTEKYRPLEEMFRKAGIDALLTEKIDEEVWTKFIFLSPFAGVTSLFGKNFGEVLSGADSRPMLEGMMKEIRTLAGLKGITLPVDIVEQSLAKGEAFPPDTRSSMQLDCERGRRSEIEPLLGFVVREGERLGADFPLTRGVYDALRMREEAPCSDNPK